MVWAAPGQVAKAAPAEAMKHLRADLLPPHTAGPPVTPFSAHAGAAVQPAYGFWDPHETEDGDGLMAALQVAVDKRAARAVIGVLLEQARGHLCLTNRLRMFEHVEFLVRYVMNA